LLDGDDVASIEWKQAIEVPIEPGGHRLQIKAGRYRSRECSFVTDTEQVINFRCNGARIWPLYVASIVKPDLVISLRRE
jgi:hypothetical protein